MPKKRILFVGEASYIATGFGTYWNEVIKRLHNTGKLEIAEIGSYAEVGDPRNAQVPWKFYPVMPNRNDTEGLKKYNSKHTNQFGEYIFDDVCLEFKPDIVIDHRDFWMSEFILRSPLRKNFTCLYMPTIDGIPQRDLWLDWYKLADGILSYSEWGMDVLKKEGRKGTNLLTVASPGADIEVFCPPENKGEQKRKLGIDDKMFIVGTIMRNQKRKLYYDLIEAFSNWVYQSKSKGHADLVKKTFLYLHTSYPDVGYDIGRAIKEFKIGNKVLMTYLCVKCHTAFPSFFMGDLGHCRKCGNFSAQPPNASHQCPREVLADIIKCFDIYVQYSICLHPETPILTQHGWRNIYYIEPGEQVIGKDGQLHAVYKTMSHKPTQCFDVKVKCRPWITTATDNHPFLRIQARKGIEGIKNLKHIETEYCRTYELEKNDLLVQTIPQNVEDPPKYFVDILDNDLSYYLGLFVADGHANQSNGSCRITLSNTDKDKNNIKLIQSVAKKFQRDACLRKCKGKAAIDVDINCKDLEIQLRRHFYDNHGKYIPAWILFGKKNIQENFVNGLLSGDGHQKTPTLNIFVTISEQVAKSLTIILQRIGWYFTCSTQQKSGNRQLQYRFEIRTDGQRGSHETLYRDNCVLLKVLYVKESNYNGEVFNIDVEDDHNYITLSGTTHNCEGWGMPLTEAQACGIPSMAVNYSAMEDHLKTPGSIPINVERFFYEAIVETEQRRALPNNKDFQKKLDRFLKLSSEKKAELSKQTREYIVEPVEVYGQEEKLPRRGWERTAAIWGNVLRDCKIKDRSTTWECQKSRTHNPNTVPPSYEMNNTEFVRWVIADVWNRPEYAHTQFAGEWARYLQQGFMLQGGKQIRIDRNYVLKYFYNIVMEENKVEQKRLNIIKEKDPQQINILDM